MMTEVEHMMSLFLCLLHNDMTKNMSLPYVVIHGPVRFAEKQAETLFRLKKQAEKDGL